MNLSFTTDLTAIHCGECGGTYAIDSRYYRQRQQGGGYWNCPYCQIIWGFSKDASETVKLKRKLENIEAVAERERSWRKDTERRLSATRGVVTRIKNRVSNGVCPCCNRHFRNLYKHMESKHPNYVKSEK